MDDLPTFSTIFMVPIITAFCLHGFKRQVKRLSKPLCLKICKDEGDKDKLSKRADANGELMYKGIFYLTSSVIGYIIMKDTPILPRALGGSGDIDNIFAGIPY